MSVRALLLVVISALFTNGCDTPFADELRKTEAFFFAYVDSLRTGHIEHCHELLLPELQGEGSVGVLEALQDSLNGVWADDTAMVGWNITHFTTGESTSKFNLAYEVGIDGRRKLLQMEGMDNGNGWRVVRFFFTPMERSMAEANAFTLQGKSSLHLSMLLVMMVVLGTIGVTIVSVLRSQRRRKWLWVLLSLIGTGSVTLNWTTGDVTGSLLHVQLLGIGLSQSMALSPWMLSVSLPTGAILYWVTGGRSGEREAPPITPSPPAPAS